jgi:anti-sigma factor ChrR (cupin superfamily)
MHCRNVEKTLFAWAEDTLTPADKSAVSAHLESCPSCQILAKQFEAVVPMAVSSHAPKLSLRFQTGLFRRIDELESGTTSRKNPFTAVQTILRPVAASAMLVLSVWAGIHLGNSWLSLAAPEAAVASVNEDILPTITAFNTVPDGSLANFYIGTEQ